MPQLFHFPTFNEMHPHEKRLNKRMRDYFRYKIRTRLYRRHILKLVDFLTAHPLWATLFVQTPYRMNTLLSKYCDKRFNTEQRLNAIIDNFVSAEQNFSAAHAEKLVNDGRILLAELTEELNLYLNINQIDPFEGFFSLNIADHEQKSVYDASFTFLAPNKLLIASIQGPNDAQAQESVRAATKRLHGVRPMFMLINGFKMLAQTLDCELLGIAHKNQTKYRWNDSTKLLFDYNSFWQENGAVLNSSGYWTLPKKIEMKPLQEIQSKKRSMYRKRYEMFESAAVRINRLFNQG
ncbi:VirK/YbjX family protein [Caviibacterium pharyngocola]|uniref:DUF535 domain-containing protein n=1 Tax=Caviibacterium pharyngocola TaxID=28159 RepID=A0A2M8RSY6_9PAST|nr:DUF535 family protein [Caviibacterium pharyngocola]PJG82000.1 DUF535 domain-containing protein [Caviibacterium pharyngocola]